jgi:phenol hydroxylase P5 protein
VSRIETLTPTIKAIFIELDEAIHFQAGQYVNVHLPSLNISRAFSLANVPSTGREVELNIRIVPGGVGTTYLHEQLKAGDRIKISGPYGRFFVRKSANSASIFMAGGSGLSSPRSMILDLLEEGSTLPITLVYGQRTRNELYYHDEFVALAEKHPTSPTSRRCPTSRPIPTGRASAATCMTRRRRTSTTTSATTRPTCAGPR